MTLDLGWGDSVTENYCALCVHVKFLGENSLTKPKPFTLGYKESSKAKKHGGTSSLAP